MLTIETPIFENDYASKFNLIMKTGKNFFLSYVSVTETNKIKIILEENN